MIGLIRRRVLGVCSPSLAMIGECDCRRHRHPVVEPAVDRRVRDRDKRVWWSWEDAAGNRWWGLVDNEDADPLDWASLRSECGPLRLVRKPRRQGVTS